MARPGALSTSQLATVRTVSGVIAADSATLSDANFPVASGFDCRGFDTVFIGVEITAGSSPTATVELLFRDADAADGLRWKRLLLGAPPGVTLGAAAATTTGALDGTALYELRCYGRVLVFPRITAVTNSGSTSAISILAMGGQTRNTARQNRD